jgi:hypothetical protein
MINVDLQELIQACWTRQPAVTWKRAPSAA